MHTNKMTSLERRAIISLSSIMGIRMIGLFMVLPMFTLYAMQLPGATPALLGLSLGIYGLSQALLQIPFGILSDKFGRKPMILIGLLIFIAGSVISGFAHSITILTIGRALQGAGAIGSTILAMMADLTREDQRTKSMAIYGISIGFSFSLAFFVGPLLLKWVSVSGLFYLAGLFGVASILILFTSVPTPTTTCWHRDTEPELKSFLKLLIEPELAKLNSGIFILHAIFMASFTVIPISLHRLAGLTSDHQVSFYLPILLVAFTITIACVGMAERKQQLKPYFLGGIIAITASQIILWLAPSNLMLAGVGVCIFFAAFSLMEAFLPSLISRTAPVARKGSALGLYSCSQFFGIFVGGFLGGFIFGKFSFAGVYLFCIVLALFWLILALLMQPPRYLVNQMWRLLPAHQHDWDTIAAKLHAIPGIVEVTFIAGDGVAYLKMERATAKHPDLIRLKEHTIGIIS